MGQAANHRSIELLGVTVDALSKADALEAVRDLVEKPSTDLIAFANAHLLNLAWHDATYQTILSDHALVLNDGVGVSMAARLYGFEFPVNLNGTDFTPEVLAMAAANRWRVAMIGAQPGVAQRAADSLSQRIDGLNVVATQHGFINDEESMTVAQKWSELEIDILLVGMGCPRQERWAAAFAGRSGASVSMSIGAFIDFAAGVVPRAPSVIRKMRLEWLYRLRREPRRMFGRYVVGNPTFLYRAILCRARETSPARHPF